MIDVRCIVIRIEGSADKKCWPVGELMQGPSISACERDLDVPGQAIRCGLKTLPS